MQTNIFQNFNAVYVGLFSTFVSEHQILDYVVEQSNLGWGSKTQIHKQLYFFLYLKKMFFNNNNDVAEWVFWRKIALDQILIHTGRTEKLITMR